MNKATKPCDDNDLDSVSRRKAVKRIVGGVSALAAYNMLPIKWEKPIIEQIFLPAHAQTSSILENRSGTHEDPEPLPVETVTYDLTVSDAGFPSGTSRQCDHGYLDHNISGTATASDGSSMAGVTITINVKQDPDVLLYDPNLTLDSAGPFTFIVAEDGTFGGRFTATGTWHRPETIVTATFSDQVSYGTATATTSATCQP